jgi:hypothetical protein
MDSIKTSASTAVQIQISTNSGSTYISTGYVTSQLSFNESSSGTWSVDSNSTSYLMAIYTTASTVYGSSGVYLYNLTSGSGLVESRGFGINLDPSNHAYGTSESGAYLTASTTVNALKLIPASGTFSGNVSLFGILP